MARRYFGTDGIRDRVGSPTVNPAFVLKLGWAVGRAIRDTGRREKVLIGKDTRISGYMLESALEAGLSAAGVDIVLLGPMPTPAIAYLTRTFRAAVGIVISASHNVFEDNGIKFFDSAGRKISDDMELAIETYMGEAMDTAPSADLGKAQRMADAPGRYIEFCKSTISSKVSLSGLKIVVDCANGACYHIAPSVFRELGATVIDMNVAPDGFNINQDCGSTKPQQLQRRVLAEQADMGIAFDGDGDRVVMVDDKGQLLDGDDILYLIACHHRDSLHMNPGVVGTVMSNMGLEKSLAEKGIGFCRTAVGDRHVVTEMLRRGWLLGGEPSGHIVWFGATTTGDGIISALQVLAACHEGGFSLSEGLKDLKKFPQLLRNIAVTDKQAVLNDPNVLACKRELEDSLGGAGRLSLRASGTEPVVRIMVEGNDAAAIAALADTLEREVQKASDSLPV